MQAKTQVFSSLKRRRRTGTKRETSKERQEESMAPYATCLQMSGADRSDNISYDSLSVCGSLPHLLGLLPALKRSAVDVDTPRLKLVVMAPVSPNHCPIKTSTRVSLIRSLSGHIFFCGKRVRLRHDVV